MEHPLGHVEEPELVVTGGRQQGQQAGQPAAAAVRIMKVVTILSPHPKEGLPGVICGHGIICGTGMGG